MLEPFRATRFPSADVQEDAASALCTLSVNDENSFAIASARGVPALIALLASSSIGVQEVAACALRNLSTNVENRATMTAAGVVRPLTALLASPSDYARAHAVEALSQLGVEQ